MEKALVLNSLFFILDSLKSKGIWGARHTEERNVKKGMPSWLVNSKKGKKAIMEAIKIGINNRFLLAKPSTGEIHISLNPMMAKEITTFLEKAEEMLKGKKSAEEIWQEIGF